MIKAEFKKNVSLIKRHSSNLAALIHSCAMFALEQVNIEGNSDPMNQLVSALHHSQRKQALVAWFEDHSKANLQEDKTFKYNKNKKIIMYVQGKATEFEIDEAIVHGEEFPYYDYTKESKPSTSFDVLKAVEALLRKIETKSASGIQVDHYELKEKLALLVPTE